MGSSAIFLKRLVKSWKYQYGVYRSVADWTIMLYMIIPAVVIFFFIYRSWWSEVPPWLEHIPFFLFFFLLYLLSWSGSIRTYVEEADKVFLIKKPHVFRQMRKWAYSYSLLFEAFVMGQALFILLPFFVTHYQLSWQQIGVLLFYFISLKPGVLLCKYVIGRIEKRFIKVLLGMLAFMTLSLFSQLFYYFWEGSVFLPIYIGGILLLFVSISFSLPLLKKIRYINYEIERTQQAKTKNIELILKMSQTIETPVVSKRTKPLFFRRSKRIFKNRTPVNGFIELFLKMFSRNRSYRQGYLQIFSVTTVVMVIVPALWLKIFLFIVILFILYSWLSLIWDKIMSTNPLTSQYKEASSYDQARRKTLLSVVLVTVVFLVIVITAALIVKSVLLTSFAGLMPMNK